MSQSLLSKVFAVSLLLHAGLFGLLVLEASKRPVFFDTPLRVRILEPPGPQVVPQPPPAAEAGPKARPGPVEVPRQGDRSAKPQTPIATERLTPRPIPAPDTPKVPEKPEGLIPPPPPQVAARPTPEPAVPRTERIPEAPRETAPPGIPERSGLSLGGPAPGTSRAPASGGQSATSGPGRPSLRDQIASLGSGLTEDVGGIAKRTVSLDSREEHFVEYLARLKRRVQRVWDYPEEALKHGISGELLILFTLNKAGSLTYIRLVQSSGYPILDEEALRAIKLAAPFDPFLPQMGDESLNISASFHYDLQRRFRRN